SEPLARRIRPRPPRPRRHRGRPGVVEWRTRIGDAPLGAHSGGRGAPRILVGDDRPRCGRAADADGGAGAAPVTRTVLVPCGRAMCVTGAGVTPPSTPAPPAPARIRPSRGRDPGRR